MLERISLPAAPASLPSSLSNLPLPRVLRCPQSGEPPGLGTAYRSDKVVCGLVRAAGLLPAHALALLTTQNHARFLAAKREHLGPFPGQIVGWLDGIWPAKSLSAT